MIKFSPEAFRISVKLRKPHRGDILVEGKYYTVAKPHRGDILEMYLNKKKKCRPAGALSKTACLSSTKISPRMGLCAKI